MKTKLFLTGLALVAVALFTTAQIPGGEKGGCNSNCNGTNKCAAFVDQNKNGICDTYENRVPGNETKNGNCNGSGQGVCKGKTDSGTNQKGDCNSAASCIKK